MKLKDGGVGQGKQQDILAMIRRSKARYFAEAQNWMAENLCSSSDSPYLKSSPS